MQKIFIGVISAGLLGACAPRASLSRSAETVRLTVPFFPNSTDQCGPAALASILNYWGSNVTPDDLKNDIYLPKLRGTLPMDIAPAAQKYGLQTRVISGSFDDIKTELRQNHPVLAYLDFGTKKHPIGHFLVVTGFDDDSEGLYVHSSDHKDKFASYARFDRGWKDADHWMLIAGPAGPNVVMRAPRPAPHIEAVLSAQEHFELGTLYENKKLMKDAETQYQLALKLNKNFEPALMALGNLAFDKNDYVAAEKYYRRVLAKNPAHGGANNNMAMVYLKTGKDLKTAEGFATKAAKTDYRPYANDTLAQIKAAQAR